MKVREGFVSNSSSCSFVCDICMLAESGFDMSIQEAGMYMCIDGHTFCESHIDMDSDELFEAVIKIVSKEEEVADDELEDLRDSLSYEYRYEIPVALCPICNHTFVSDEAAVNYLLGIVGKTREEINQEIRETLK